MSPGAEPGFCNLECWCHVPTRGVNKPPCYLCVINSCSLSTKKTVAPSAPELSPTVERSPLRFPSHSASLETLSAMGASSRASRYGWHGNLVRNSSTESDRGPEGSRREFRELFVRLPPERSAEVANNTNQEVPVEVEVQENFASDPANVEVPEDTPEQEEIPDDPPADYPMGVEVVVEVVDPDRSSEREVDLAEMIRSIVIEPKDDDDEDDNADDEDKDEALPERRSRSGIRSPNDRNKTRRRRDKYQGFERYQSLYSLGAKSICIPRVSVSSHQSTAQNNPVQNETEFQKLHKIHRRDTSSDAARRYLQSDENLHRTWMREVAVRRRNYPRRSRSTKRHEDGGHRPIFSHEESWKSRQRQMSKNFGGNT